MENNLTLFQFGVANMTLTMMLDGVTNDDSLMGTGEGNCINWIAGHILTARDILLESAGEGKFLTEEEKALYRSGSSAIDGDSQSLPIEKIKEGLSYTSGKISEVLAGVTAEKLSEPMDPSYFPVPVEDANYGKFLNLLFYHEAYHTGQIGLNRRLLGKKNPL